MRVEDVLADGDLVAYRATVTGTHRGELLGIPPTDRSFRVEHMHFLRLRDGKAAEHWACRDDLGMLTQLGVIRGLAPGS
jgi:predicted ester cyclase